MLGNFVEYMHHMRHVERTPWRASRSSRKLSSVLGEPSAILHGIASSRMKRNVLLREVFLVSRPSLRDRRSCSDCQGRQDLRSAPCKYIVPGIRHDHIPCFDPAGHIAQMADLGSGRTPPPPEGADRSRLLTSEPVFRI
jgi:hypothetical protein